MRNAILSFLTMLFLQPALVLIPVASAAMPSFSQQPFTDITPSHPNYEAIEYLRTQNILKGYLDGAFHPERRIIRADFVTLMTNEFFLHSRDNNCLASFTASESMKTVFPDVSNDAPYATDVCVAKTTGLIHGYPDGRFRGWRPVSLVEAAKIVVRVFALQTPPSGEISERWYTVYIDLLSKMRALPASALARGLERPITRGEVAEMIYRLKQTQHNQ